jgi:hypothetical protein
VARIIVDSYLLLLPLRKSQTRSADQTQSRFVAAGAAGVAVDFVEG